jgi:hypothetical protein
MNRFFFAYSFVSLTIMLFSCNQSHFREIEKKEMYEANHLFLITRKFNYDHKSWLEGLDSTGKIDQFGYGSFSHFDDLVMPGDTFYKIKGSFDFYIYKKNSVCHFIWTELKGGQLINCDSSMNRKYLAPIARLNKIHNEID